MPTNDTGRVAEQYKDARNLNTRMKLHGKYSTNPYGFPDWRFDLCRFFPGCRVLELGAGPGAFWEDRLDSLPPETELTISDFSPGMVQELKEKYAGRQEIVVQQIDITEIPYPADSFDIVIANHMLYHVPDIPKALSEVCRVLKHSGVFYTSTISSGGMHGYLHKALLDFDPQLDFFSAADYAFTVENGAEQLHPFFREIELQIHEDALRITDTQDLVDWIGSTAAASDIPREKLRELYDYFEQIRQQTGIISIPKRSGMFLCKL